MPQHPRKDSRNESVKGPQVVVAVFGRWPCYTRKRIEKEIKQCQRKIKQYRWKMTKSLQGNTTHVILSPWWVENMDDRFQLIDKSNFKRLEWLIDCAARGKLLNEPKYCWFPEANSYAARNPTSPNPVSTGRLPRIAPKDSGSIANLVTKQKHGIGEFGMFQHSGKEFEVTLQQVRKHKGQDRMRVYNMKVCLHYLIRKVDLTLTIYRSKEWETVFILYLNGAGLGEL